MAAPILTNKQVISSLYVAAFGRAPDQAGLEFWNSQVTEGQSVQSVINTIGSGFSNNVVFIENNSTLSPLDFVNALYTNLLNGSGDAAGVQFWVKALTPVIAGGNGWTQSQVLNTFVTAALTYDATAASSLAYTPEVQAQALLNQQALVNKATVGAYFAGLLPEASALSPDAIEYTDIIIDPAYQASQAILDSITSDVASVNIAWNVIFNASKEEGASAQLAYVTENAPASASLLTTNPATSALELAFSTAIENANTNADETEAAYTDANDALLLAQGTLDVADAKAAITLATAAVSAAALEAKDAALALKAANEVNALAISVKGLTADQIALAATQVTEAEDAVITATANAKLAASALALANTQLTVSTVAAEAIAAYDSAEAAYTATMAVADINAANTTSALILADAELVDAQDDLLTTVELATAAVTNAQAAVTAATVAASTLAPQKADAVSALAAANVVLAAANKAYAAGSLTSVHIFDAEAQVTAAGAAIIDANTDALHASNVLAAANLQLVTAQAGLITAVDQAAKVDIATTALATFITTATTAQASALAATNAATAAAVAITAVNDLVTANAAVTAAALAKSTAATAKTDATAEAVAAAALVAATTATTVTTDDAAATAASATAATAATAANAAVAAAATAATAAASLVTTYTPATFTLTTGVDTLVGNAANDTFVAKDVLAVNLSNSINTLGMLDSIDGGAGINTLNITSVNNITSPIGLSIKNIQIANLRSGYDITENTSTWTGLTTLNATQSRSATLTAAATTDVNVSGATDDVTVTGGLTQTVTTAGGGSITLSKAAGAIVVTDTAQGNHDISIQDGTSVSLTVTQQATGAGNSIKVGATSHLPTGAVTIIANQGPEGSSTFFGGNITVNGGTIDTVTINATQPLLATAGANSTTTQSYVAVNGGAATTTVTVNQTAAVTAVNTVLAVAGVTEADTATFVALASGQFLTVDNLTFTAGAAGTTAAQTAAAFANLTKWAEQGNSVLGVYSGSSFGNWTTGAVTGTAAVKFTSTAANTATTAPGFTGTGTAPAVVNVTTGVTAVKAAGAAGIDNGFVQIIDASYSGAVGNTISSVTVNGYAHGATGAASSPSDNFVQSNALISLSLANATANSNFAVLNKTATTLALTVNNLASGSGLYLDGTYKTLAITTAAKNSAVNIGASGVTALTVTGTKDIDLTASTLSKLKTVTISGAAGVTLASVVTVTDINASATSGNVVVSNFDASVGTYEGGSGDDSLTVLGNVSKAISLGAGNNTLTLASPAAVISAAINGGNGTTDTLVMDSSLAAAASLSVLGSLNTLVTGFERLTVNGATTPVSIDVVKLGNFNYVTDASTSPDALTVMNLASAGTLVLSGTSQHNVTVDLSVASTALNSLNIVLSAAGNQNNNNSVTVNANANVKTVNIAAIDTTEGVVAGTHYDDFTLTAAAATTITVTGNASLNLYGANTNVTLVDATAATGGLYYWTVGTTAQTVKGSATASNYLGAQTGVNAMADTLIGGAADDYLEANNNLTTMTGNGGNDSFYIYTPNTSNSYATITDANVGDVIQFQNISAFNLVKETLAPTAVFQDYANAAVFITAPAQDNAAWFQFGGNTYIVENKGVIAHSSFINGTDLIVKLTGLVDLSHASVNTQYDTLLIG